MDHDKFMNNNVHTNKVQAVNSIDIIEDLDETKTLSGIQNLEIDLKKSNLNMLSSGDRSLPQHCNHYQDISIDDTLDMNKPTSIMVTGGAGFIGSHILENMLNNPSYNSFNVIVVDKLSYVSSVKNFQNFYNDNKYKKRFSFYHFNLIDYSLLENVFKLNNIEIIINCAADSDVDYSFENPSKVFQNNTMSLHNLIQLSIKFKIKKFIHFSTDEVYGPSIQTSSLPPINDHDHDIKDLTNKLFNENSALNPTNPYSVSKASGDLLLLSYAKSKSLPIIILRFNNVYGPRQFPEKIIPKFILNLKKAIQNIQQSNVGSEEAILDGYNFYCNPECMGSPITGYCPIHGNGKQSRRYLYISDVISAVILILEKGNFGEIYNVGIDDYTEITNNNLTKLLIKMMIKRSFSIEISEVNNTNGSKDQQQLHLQSYEDQLLDENVLHVKDRPFNDDVYRIDWSKIKQLGWVPKVDLEEGLKKTICWFEQDVESWWDKPINIFSYDKQE